jgi:4-amino-4-deoxy-L-arabinose transferase-like glycosyltransferase
VRRPLVVALLATLATRVALIVATREPPRWDGYFYARFADAIAHGHGYAVVSADAAPRPTAFYPVGYPAALAAALHVAADPRVAAALVNLVAALVAVVAVVAVAHRAGGEAGARRAGFMYALYPGAVLWCGAAMTETLHGALLAIALTATALPQTDAGRRGGAVATGLALGAATLVRPQSLLLLPLATLGARSWRERAVAMALACVATAAVVGPWTARNCARLDACALVSTNGGSNLLIGTFPDARGGYRRPGAEDGCADVRGEVRRDRCMTQVARARIRDNPGQWLALDAMKLVGTFAWEHDPVSYLRGERRDRFGPWAYGALIALCTAAWWALLAMAWRGLGRGRANDASAAATRFAVGALAATAFTHGVFLGADRYHLIVVPLLCVVAGIASTGRVKAQTAVRVPEGTSMLI